MTLETVTTEISPPANDPAEDGITSAATGFARPNWVAARAGPATSVSAAISMDTPANVSAAGRPRPPGRPIARAPATIQVTHAAAPATPIRPRKSPASNVASMPMTRAPNASPGGSPTAAAMVTSGASPARSGNNAMHATIAEAVASMMSPATRPSGVPSAIAMSANPPKPGMTSPKNSRRVIAACARAAAPNAAAMPIEARTTLNSGFG